MLVPANIPFHGRQPTGISGGFQPVEANGSVPYSSSQEPIEEPCIFRKQRIGRFPSLPAMGGENEAVFLEPSEFCPGNTGPALQFRKIYLIRG